MHKITITEAQNKQRIDSLAAALFPTISRSQWTARGVFICDGEEKDAKTKVRVGEEWTIRYHERVDLSKLTPWNHPLKILAESDTWVAIEKPVGMAVHPSPSDPGQQTVLNALVHQFHNHLSEAFDTIEGQTVARPGLIHRLDKETSGVLLIAKNNTTHTYFQKHWKDVEKIYMAIVKGIPPLQGKIEAGIMRDKCDRQKMAVSDGPLAKPALTYFERLETNEQKNTSLLRVRIPTGRTHQIRVHMSCIGFALLGDKKYGGCDAERLLLHAHMLTFPDPDKNGDFTTVTSPVPFEN